MCVIVSVLVLCSSILLAFIKAHLSCVKLNSEKMASNISIVLLFHAIDSGVVFCQLENMQTGEQNYDYTNFADLHTNTTKKTNITKLEVHW